MSFQIKPLLKRERLEFDNNWMRLHVKSMGKLHQVVSLLPSTDSERSGHVAVAAQGNMDMIAVQYPAKRFRSDSLDGGSDLYIQSDKFYFSVEHISKSVDDSNRYMMLNEDTALIATDNYGQHYVARIDPTPFKPKPYLSAA